METKCITASHLHNPRVTIVEVYSSIADRCHLMANALPAQVPPNRHFYLRVALEKTKTSYNDTTLAKLACEINDV